HCHVHIVILFKYVLFFFLIIRQPTRSTLFPYTTLFRSLKFNLISSNSTKPVPNPNQRRLLSRTPIPGVANSASARRARLSLQLRDRKSTRLNSSHVSISYAVFCLKKKIE